LACDKKESTGHSSARGLFYETLSKKDILLIIVIISIGFLLLGIRRWTGDPINNTTRYAEINHGGVVHTQYLYENKIFSLPSAPHVIFEIKNGQIAFIQSNCPDQICVLSGFQSRPGQMAACLPNRLIMTLFNKEPDSEDMDVVTR
jgi:hypothetical protein